MCNKWYKLFFDCQYSWSKYKMLLHLYIYLWSLNFFHCFLLLFFLLFVTTKQDVQGTCHNTYPNNSCHSNEEVIHLQISTITKLKTSTLYFEIKNKSYGWIKYTKTVLTNVHVIHKSHKHKNVFKVCKPIWAISKPLYLLQGWYSKSIFKKHWIFFFLNAVNGHKFTSLKNNSCQIKMSTFPWHNGIFLR